MPIWAERVKLSIFLPVASPLITDGVLDPYNFRRDYSYSDLSQRHRFVGSVVWQPRFASDLSNKVVRQVVDGWSASGIITAARVCQ
jgi:hypothetical protein